MGDRAQRGRRGAAASKPSAIRARVAAREVGVGLGLGEQLAERGRVGVAVDPEAQLLLGEAQLAQLGAVELGAGLEVLGRDAELLREPAQRLHRRRPRARLDPRDVGVGDPGLGEVALRGALLDPQPPQAPPTVSAWVSGAPVIRARSCLPNGPTSIGPCQKKAGLTTKEFSSSPVAVVLTRPGKEVVLVLSSLSPRRARARRARIGARGRAAWRGAPWGP